MTDLLSLRDDAIAGPWGLARGGRSINTGEGGKIRMESHPKTMETMRFIVTAYTWLPDLMDAAGDVVERLTNKSGEFTTFEKGVAVERLHRLLHPGNQGMLL